MLNTNSSGVGGTLGLIEADSLALGLYDGLKLGLMLGDLDGETEGLLLGE